MTLNEAINKRTSVRKFKELPMAAAELKNFAHGIEAIPNLFTQISNVNSEDTKSKLAFKIMTYAEASSKFSNFGKECYYAPYYLFFYGDETNTAYLSCGYISQIASLWLTCNNLSTCIQRTSKLVLSTDKENAEEDTNLTEEKRLKVALAFGQAANNKPACHKKPANKKYIPGSPAANINLELLLQTACQAPSEYNSQPWRFWANDNTVHIFANEGILFRSKWHQFAANVACGAVVANLATLAELKNLPYQIFYEQQAFSEIEKLTYQLSFRLL